MSLIYKCDKCNRSDNLHTGFTSVIITPLELTEKKVLHFCPDCYRGLCDWIKS